MDIAKAVQVFSAHRTRFLARTSGVYAPQGFSALDVPGAVVQEWRDWEAAMRAIVPQVAARLERYPRAGLSTPPSVRAALYLPRGSRPGFLGVQDSGSFELSPFERARGEMVSMVREMCALGFLIHGTPGAPLIGPFYPLLEKAPGDCANCEGRGFYGPGGWDTDFCPCAILGAPLGCEIPYDRDHSKGPGTPTFGGL